jgi:hypothetical protein
LRGSALLAYAPLPYRIAAKPIFTVAKFLTVHINRDEDLKLRQLAAIANSSRRRRRNQTAPASLILPQ